MKKLRISLITGLVAGLWAFVASAGPITVRYEGFAVGSQSGTIAGARNASVNAGQFQFDVLNNGGYSWLSDPLLGFCVDVTTNLVTSGPATYNLALASTRFNAQQLSLIGSLYDQRASSLTSASNSAAFQLALWEIVYDPTVRQVASGSGSNDFWASTNFGSSRATAQTWLGSLNATNSYVSSNFQFYVLNPVGTNQAILIARPVPEPGTLALLGAGLLACGVVGRRRRVRVQ